MNAFTDTIFLKNLIVPLNASFPVDVIVHMNHIVPMNAVVNISPIVLVIASL